MFNNISGNFGSSLLSTAMISSLTRRRACPERALVLGKFYQYASFMYQILPIQPQDILTILEMAAGIFTEAMFDVPTHLKRDADWPLSVKLLELETGRLAGFYLFNQLEYKGLHGRGLQGVALGVAPEHREKGAGKLLIQYPYQLPFDYIWGQHLAWLNNREHWAKRRQILEEEEWGFVTAGSLKGDPQKLVWEFPFLHQPDGWSCGCTVIKMLLEWEHKALHTSIGQIAKVCGTDPITGTDDKKMKKGLHALGLKHQQNKTPGDAAAQLHYLNQLLDRGDVFALRGLVEDIKHWYLVFARNGDYYYVNDPWLGRRVLHAEALLASWAPRGWDGFRVFLKRPLNS